jgi:hypothetical protein
MFKPVRFAALIGAVALSCGTANAESLFAFLLPPSQTQIAPQAAAPAPTEERDDAQLDPRLRRQIVNYSSREAPGTLVIDTPHTFLTTFSVMARRSVTASVSAAKVSPGRA